MTWTPSAGELIDERFLLERELARGSMGQVWLAEHVPLACPCAMKFIDEKYVDSAFLRERFKREAQAAARLRSRHVVQILDFGVWRGVPYIAMELLEGETLADRLDRRGQLTAQETMSLLQGVARALAKAGSLGIVHRDLKPENVFIVRDGVHEYAKVLDFGVAKLRDTAMMDSRGDTKPGAHVGTPYYMSPEQADGAAPVDPRSDLWSFAVIVYECLTGEVPFYEEGLGRLLMQIMAAPLPVPSRVNPDLSPRFDAWWKRAADRDPDRRFQDAESAVDALFDALIDLEDSLSSWPALAARKTAVFSAGARSFPSISSLPPADTLPPLSDSLADPPLSDPPLADLALVGPFPSARPPTSEPPLYSSRPGAAPPRADAPVSPARRGVPMPWVVAAVTVALVAGAWASRTFGGAVAQGTATDDEALDAALEERSAPAAQAEAPTAQTPAAAPTAEADAKDTTAAAGASASSSAAPAATSPAVGARPSWRTRRYPATPPPSAFIPNDI